MFKLRKDIKMARKAPRNGKKNRKSKAQRRRTHTAKYGKNSPLPKRKYKNRRKKK